MPSKTVKKICGFASICFAFVATVFIGEFAQGSDTDEGYLGGMTADNIFAYHPFLMTSGMIFSSILALHSYHVLNLSHGVQKAIHVCAHSSALICFGIGLHCVLKAHNDNNKPNLYSMHSWVGLAAAVVYIQQYVLGFVYFLSGKVNIENVKNYMPSHVTLGIFSLCLSMAAAISGITEMNKCVYTITSPDLNPASHYADDMSPACKLVQGGGICIVVATMLSVYALIPERQPHKLAESDGHFDEPSIKSSLLGV